MTLEFLKTVKETPKPAKTGPDFTVFATMCIHRHVDPESFNSLLELLHCPNPRFSFSKRRGDALIDRARSMEASRFLLKSNAEVLLFLDDDIIYDPLDAVKMVRHVHEGKDIVGGAYTLKTEGGGQFTTKLLPETKSIVMGEGGGLYEVRMVATGFMAVHRRVFEKVSKKIPFCSVREMDGFWPFFQPFPKFIEENNKWFYLSEDWAFCERAREEGFKVWLDSTIKLKHAGRTTYSWDDFTREPKKDVKSLVYSEKFSAKDANPGEVR